MKYFTMQNPSGIYVCSAIFIIILIYIVFSIVISSIYKLWISQVRSARNSGGEAFKSKMLNEIFNDYKESTEMGNDNINTEAVIDKHFPYYIERVEFILNYLVAVTTILGLFGTFIGLTGAIMDLKSVLIDIQRMEQFIEGIKPPLASMATAFITSIVGIAASFIMNIASAVPSISYKNYREQFYDELIDYLDNSTYAKYNPSTNKALIIFTEKVEKSMQYMTDRVTQTFDEGIKHFANKINMVSVDLTESARALSDTINKLENSIGMFNTPVLSFKQSVDSFKLYYEGLDTKIRDIQIIADGLRTNFEKVITSLNSNSENIDNIGKQLINSTNNLAEEHSKFSSLLDNIQIYSQSNDERIRNSIRSMEDVYSALVTILRDLKEQAGEMGNQVSSKLSSVLNMKLKNLATDLNDSVKNNYDTVQATNKSFEEKLDIFGRTLNSYNKLLGELEQSVNERVDMSETAVGEEE
jgi:uncharacterized protein YukE